MVLLRQRHHSKVLAQERSMVPVLEHSMVPVLEHSMVPVPVRNMVPVPVRNTLAQEHSTWKHALLSSGQISRHRSHDHDCVH